MVLQVTNPYTQRHDAESKSAKIQNSLHGWGGGGGGGASEPNFQLLMLSLNLLKSKIPFVESFPEFFLSFCHDFIMSRVVTLNTIWPLIHYAYMGG